jgi:ferritin-like metal-binding protein YciE
MRIAFADQGNARARSAPLTITHEALEDRTMAMESLEKLLVNELKDLYSAEKQILQALPKMAKAASNPELQKAFRTHEKQTQEHVRRIEQVFEGGQLDGAPAGKKCKGMEGLIEEGKEVLQEDMPDSVRDAALIGAAQRVEHYEMAAYGTVRSMAEQLGLRDAAKLLQQTLDEEGQTDELLTKIAEGMVNRQAEAAD